MAQWNGSTWSRVTVPQPGNDGLNSNLNAISADGPDDVWNIVPMPLVGSSNVNAFFHFNAIQVNSPTDVWAVGDQGVTDSTKRGERRVGC